uniref:Uncharacterized protein n=1 Tax=Anguilla anguilla TaxID=7936 RepID=A0A0E9X8Q0_ANGAN
MFVIYKNKKKRQNNSYKSSSQCINLVPHTIARRALLAAAPSPLLSSDSMPQ